MVLALTFLSLAYFIFPFKSILYSLIVNPFKWFIFVKRFSKCAYLMMTWSAYKKNNCTWKKPKDILYINFYNSKELTNEILNILADFFLLHIGPALSFLCFNFSLYIFLNNKNNICHYKKAKSKRFQRKN